MSNETLRSKDRQAFWFIVAISLAPLIPYALRGPSEQAAVGADLMGAAQPAVIAPAMAS
jgi:hypothetical protein